MTKRKIIAEPNIILRKKSVTLEKVDDDLRELMDDMLDTMYAANGIGLAAIQIGVPKNVVVIDLNKDNLQLLKSETIVSLDKLDEVINEISSLNTLKISLNNIETQLILLEDSVQALNNYKNQLNQVILEIQTEISNAQNNATLNEVLQN